MNFGDFNFYIIFDLFVLLLIGMGPKIALVPFLELTAEMDADTQKKVARQMVKTAVVWALILVLLGWFLMQLLHFTPGAANIAGGIVLLLLALHMLVSPAKNDHHEKASGRDALKMGLDVVAYSALQRARLAQARAVHLHPTQLTPGVVSTIRESGVQVHAWDVNDKRALETVADLNIPKFSTDQLQQAIKFLDRLPDSG